MSLFKRWKTISIANGLRGTATIRVSEPYGEPGLREAGDSIFDLELNLFGTRGYRLVLEVRLEGEEPYEIDGRFDVPRRAENTGLLAGSVGNALCPGLELPVLADPRDRDRVEVDWQRFLADPGRKQAQKATEQVAYERQLTRTNDAVAVKALAKMVRNGQLSREQFDFEVSRAIENGHMDPGDVERARAGLD
jgi:hypothetical protein